MKITLAFFAASALLLSQDAKVAPPPVAPVKTEAPLTADEITRLNKAEAETDKATKERQALEGEYQRALITEQNARLTFVNAVRMLERTKCDTKTALVKPPVGTWVCMPVKPAGQ